VRVTRERLPLVTSLQLCVLAARAAGITALDGVHLDLEDDAGFAVACRQAADFGFDGKTLIHPKQVALANEIFGPAAGEVEWAGRGGSGVGGRGERGPRRCPGARSRGGRARRPSDREPARRRRTPHAGPGRGDRRAREVLISGGASPESVAPRRSSASRPEAR